MYVAQFSLKYRVMYNLHDACRGLFLREMWGSILKGLKQLNTVIHVLFVGCTVIFSFQFGTHLSAHFRGEANIIYA